MLTALVPALAGGVCVALGWPVGGAAGFTAGLLVAARTATAARRTDSPPLPLRVERGLLFAATLLAAATRLPGLAVMPPPGIHIDEHRSIWFAVEVLRGERVWPPADGAEPLSVWAFALAFLPAGPSLAAARLTMALAGTASIPLLWWALRPAAGPAVAVLAAVALAALRWHILLSRIAQPYVLVPLAAILAAGALIRAPREGFLRRWWFAGAAAGLGPWTYLAGRVMAPVFLLAAIARAPGHRRLAAAAGGMVIVLAPLLVHYAREPGSVTFRAEHLSREVRARPIAAGWRNLTDTLLAFTMRGDGALSSSWPGTGTAPLLGPVAAALCVLGLPAIGSPALGGLRPFLTLLGAAGLAIGALAGMSWPSFAARCAVLIPLLTIAQAAWLAAAVGGRTRRAVGAAALLAASGAWDAAGFLLPAARGASEAETARWTGWRDLRLARALAQAARGRPVFLTPDTNRESPGYTKFRGACLLEGVRVLDPPAPDWAVMVSRGGIGVMLSESREQRDLARECYPAAPPLPVPMPDAPPTPAELTLFTAEAPPRFPLDGFARLHAGIRAVGDLAAARRVDEALARLAALLRAWPRIGTLHAMRASILAGTGPAAFARAAAAARRAESLSGGRSAIGWNILGITALAAGDRVGAREYLTRSLALEPDQPDVRATLLQLSRITGGW